MCKTETDVLELIRDLAQALQAHHLGLTTTEPFARAYYRDHKLISQAEDFLATAEGKPQPRRTLEKLSACEFCNVTPSAHEVEVGGKPGLTALACTQCLQELQLGHVLKDVYGWSWTLFEGKFIAEYLDPEVTDE